MRSADELLSAWDAATLDSPLVIQTAREMEILIAIIRRRNAVDRSRPLGVIPDSMDALRSMVDGRMYDSKSAYYKSVRAAGCEIIGNDIDAATKHQSHEIQGDFDVRRELSQAVHQHLN